MRNIVMIISLLFCDYSAFANSYTDIQGEWRDTKEPRILKLNFDNMSLSRKGIYEGPFYFEEYPVKMYGLCEFHEKTNELYVTYTSQKIGGKETIIHESARYRILSTERNGTRCILLFADKPDQVELGMFYFYSRIK